MTQSSKLADILLVEDNEGDIELTKEAFDDAKFRNNLHIARDGDEALDSLFKRNGQENAHRPDLILLDLNLPGTDGREVLEQVKDNDSLRRIPTIVLTSSNAERDILDSYDLHANCYIVKPVNAAKFIEVIQQIEDFWIDIVCLPTSDGK